MIESTGCNVSDYAVTGRSKKSCCWRLALFAYLVAVSIAVPSTAMAAEGAYASELITQRVSASSSVSSLDDGLFGEQVDWYSGSTSFSVTDLSLPGNSSLPVAVGRFHHVGSQGPQSLGLFGNWDIDIPHIHATLLWNRGWEDACSSKRNPPSPWMELNPTVGDWIQSPYYWDGHRIHIPGAGDRLMMVGNGGGLQQPQDGGSYPWVTTDNWRFSCIPIKRGSGEGFLALSPDGVRYFFDIAFARESMPLFWRFFYDRYTSAPYYAGQGLIFRQKAYLYPSRIEDRFGNSVTYNWETSTANDPRLNSIVANDGRRIDIKYKWIEPSGVVKSAEASGYKVETITANGKSWSYEYDARSLLTGVTLPDKSTWTLSPTFAYPEFVDAGSDPCNGVAWKDAIFEYTMKHPSGAQGKFTFRMTLHGRANVYPKCEWDKKVLEDKNHSPGKYVVLPSLRRKEITGPSLSPRVWTVAWSSTPGNDASWQGENTGDTVKIVAVTGPSSYTRYTFSNNFGRDEGRLLKEETGTGQYHILSTREHAYDIGSSAPAYVRTVGLGHGAGYIGSNPSDRAVIPLLSTKVTQDGRTFSTTVEAYDSFARPIQVRRSSELLAPPPPPIDPEPIDPPPCSGCEIP